MQAFQFYVKENTAVPVDIHSDTFATEKEQLIHQGFEKTGDIIQADDSKQAFEKFKTQHLDELDKEAKWHSVTSSLFAIGL